MKLSVRRRCATCLLLYAQCSLAKTRVGIIGLPNVGKSTLFNALAQKSLAQAENFPFCTIEPNVAPIAVPDIHLARLGALAKSERTVPAMIEWVDVAGLVRGASRGEGLGNRFLAAARECDALCHVVRTFEDTDIIHVDGRIDPGEDAEVVNLELVLADLAHAERRLEKTTCRGEEQAALEAVVASLHAGQPARAAGLSAAAQLAVKSMGLLTLKPVIYAFNVDEVDLALNGRASHDEAGRLFSGIKYHEPATDMFMLVSARLEAHVAQLEGRQAQLAYLAEIGMEPPEPSVRTMGPADGHGPLSGGPLTGLDDTLSHRVLPTLARQLLGLELGYTGPGVPSERSRTTRAHLYPRGGLTAGGLAGRIHGDIQRGFLHAEVVPSATLLGHASFSAAKEAGCVRNEGRQYIISEGDVVHVKWK